MLEVMLRNGRIMYSKGHTSAHGMFDGVEWTEHPLTALTGRPLPLQVKMYDDVDLSGPPWLLAHSEIVAMREARPEWDFPPVPSPREGMES